MPIRRYQKGKNYTLRVKYAKKGLNLKTCRNELSNTQENEP